MSMNLSNSAIKKGETLIDTAMTLKCNAPRYNSCKTSRLQEHQIYYLKK